MLSKMNVNNYRCLVDFEIEFENSTLLLGTNGSGKTSLFDILYSIKRLVCENAKVSEVFSVDDLTSWENSNRQVFKLYVNGNGGDYVYGLELMHEKELGKLKIEKEKLCFKDKALFIFEKGEIQLFDDEYKAGAVFNYDSQMSGLGMVTQTADNTKLSWFKTWLKKLFILSLYPQKISAVSQEEAFYLNRDGTDFASWYRYISQEHQDRILDIFNYLRESIPGFDSMKLETAGKYKILKVGFRDLQKDDKTYFFDFSKISDGQRVLLILYTLLESLKGLGHTLLLDEPENFVALAEIQPWLADLTDVNGANIPQTIIISHHPELIDYFGVEKSVLIDREPLGNAKVTRIDEKFENGLKLSELIARGWENE